MFVNKHQDLKVCVVHGNTLTAAVILNDVPKDVTEVFLTGATSKLGRAIALYLCRRRIRVLVSTVHFFQTALTGPDPDWTPTAVICLVIWFRFRTVGSKRVRDQCLHLMILNQQIETSNASAHYAHRLFRMMQMLTLSTERFEKIKKEAPADCQNYLVQVTKYQAARTCKVY